MHYIFPISTYGQQKVMIVMNDRQPFEYITEQSIKNCKKDNISFCTILSDCKLYDLIEQKEKEIKYFTYWNYHDETYADWWFE